METNTAPADSGFGAASGATGEVVAPVADSWHSGFDQETVGWLDARGLTKLSEKEALPALVKGFRDTQKFVGAPADKLLRLPDFDKADKVELDQFYNKLGRPAESKGYDIPIPDGVDSSFADAAKAKFHELGLTSKQGKALAEWNNQFGAELSVQQQGAQQQQAKDQEASLKHEWGEAYDKQMSIAKNAATSMGFTPEKVDALQSALGYDGVMKMMASIGEKLGESGFVSGDSSTSFNGALTPAQAVSKISVLQGDKDWTAKYLAGNAEARAEMTRLQAMAYPGFMNI
jgi:hypothetical protein